MSFLKGKNQSYSANIEEKVRVLAEGLFQKTHHNLCVGNDRVFAGVMAVQWIAGILIALIVSPRTWLAEMAQTHVHVWSAVILGGLLSSLPIYLALTQPGAIINRYVNVIAQALYSALFIHLTGGRIETHFHVFASLAGFAFYRDFKVLLCGTVIVAADHAIRGIFFPQSAFGVFATSEWRWMEHAAWVLFEDFFLGYACIRSLNEMRVVATKTAEVLVQNEKIEYEVQNRTRELQESRNSIKLLLDNAGQGFMSFNSEGIIGTEYSKAVELMFGKDPAGSHVSKLLNQSMAEWSDYVNIFFTSKLTFKDIKALCPTKALINEKVIELDYKPVYADSGKLNRVMILATDVTEMKKLEKRSEEERTLNRAIIKILGSRNDFLEVLEMLEDLPNHSNDPSVAGRLLHTIKGGFAFLECAHFAQKCHELENELKEKFSTGKFKSGVQEIQALVSKFLEENERIFNFKRHGDRVIPVEIRSIEKLIDEANHLKAPKKIIRSLEEITERPVEECLNWLSDAFVTTARKLGKQVEPIQWQSSARICPELYKGLLKSLIHIARNSADHGIETSDLRAANGKPVYGKLKAQLLEDGDYYKFIFEDDGAGINAEAVRKKAEERKLPIPKSDHEVVELLMAGDFSTKNQVTATSGRGLGLSAIRAEAERLGGQMNVKFQMGQWTKIEIRFKKINRKYNEHAVPAAA